MWTKGILLRDQYGERTILAGYQSTKLVKILSVTRVIILCPWRKFTDATIDSVLTFGMICWDGNAAKQNKSRLDQNTKKMSGERGRKHKHSLSSSGEKQTEDNFGQQDTATDTLIWHTVSHTHTHTHTYSHADKYNPYITDYNKNKHNDNNQ